MRPNCLYTMPALSLPTRTDIPRIAGHLSADAGRVHRHLPGTRRGEGAYCIRRRKPCPFLGAESKCTIYDVRPEKCRGYPFTDKPDFAFMSITHANNATVCPAVFYLVEQMKKRLRR